MGLKIKNVNIMGVHQFLGEGGHKKTIYMGNCLKRGSWTICGGFAKKNRKKGVFLGVNTLMHTMN